MKYTHDIKRGILTMTLEGDLIGEAESKISARVHAGITGEVVAVGDAIDISS